MFSANVPGGIPPSTEQKAGPARKYASKMHNEESKGESNIKANGERRKAKAASACVMACSTSSITENFTMPTGQR